MAGSRQGSQRQTAEIDFFAVLEPTMRVLQPSSRRREDAGSLEGQLAAPRDEVGVEVGLRAEFERQPALLCSRQVGPRITARVEEKSPVIPQLDQVGVIAQALIGDGDDLGHDSSSRGSSGCRNGCFGDGLLACLVHPNRHHES
jgi:hypothetical protein